MLLDLEKGTVRGLDGAKGRERAAAPRDEAITGARPRGQGTTAVTSTLPSDVPLDALEQASWGSAGGTAATWPGWSTTPTAASVPLH